MDRLCICMTWWWEVVLQKQNTWLDHWILSESPWAEVDRQVLEQSSVTVKDVWKNIHLCNVEWSLFGLLEPWGCAAGQPGWGKPACDANRFVPLCWLGLILISMAMLAFSCHSQFLLPESLVYPILVFSIPWVCLAVKGLFWYISFFWVCLLHHSLIFQYTPGSSVSFKLS